MNVGLKKYNINDYYFAEIKNKEADVTKQELYTTILLKKGDTYVDLQFPFKTFTEENQDVKKQMVITWIYPIIGFLIQTRFKISDSCDFSPIQMLSFFYKNKNALLYQAVYLHSIQYDVFERNELKKDRRLS